MHLSFLQPINLIGLVFLLIPIIIHLLHRKRAIFHEFAALEFIMRVQRRVVHSFEFKNLLMLLVRLFIIIALTLAIARPSLVGSHNSASQADLPTDMIILFDRSASMSYQAREHQTLLEIARTEVEDLIRNAPGNVAFQLLFFDQSVSPATEEFLADREVVLEQLRQGEQQLRRTDLAQALATALEKMRLSRKPRKQIVLVSDLQKTGWDEKKQLPKWNSAIDGPPPRIIILPLGQAIDRGNLALSEVSLEYIGRGNTYEKRVSINAKVTNFSATNRNSLPISLNQGDQVLQSGFLSIPAYQSVIKEFSHQLQDQPESLFLKIDDPPFEADNRYYCRLAPFRTIKILIIDGDNQSNAIESESYYLERSLLANDQQDLTFELTIQSADSIAPEVMAKNDVIFLLNVKKLEKSQLTQLEARVKKGGLLFIALGDNIDPEWYNEHLSRVLPMPLWSEKKLSLGGEGKSVGERQERLTLGQIDPTYPAMSFFQTKGISLKQTVFDTIYLLKPPTAENSRIIIRYSNGMPALLERQVGQGQTLLFTSSLDRDWNSFPIDPLFLPFLYQILSHSGPHGRESTSPALLVGEPLILPFSQQAPLAPNLKVRDPLGQLWPLQPVSRRAELALTFTNTSRLGFYQIFEENAPTPPGSTKSPGPQVFTVNFPPAESDLRSIAPEEIEAKIKPDYQVTFLREQRQSALPLASLAFNDGIGLWRFVFLSLVLFFLLESILSRW
jgi:hypothetical protein